MLIIYGNFHELIKENFILDNEYTNFRLFSPAAKKTNLKYVEFWYDKDGYNRKGFNYFWCDKEGYNEEWYDREWYDRDWYNKEWYDRDWYNKEWFDIKWFDKDGYNKDWFNREWFDKDGYNFRWYNKYWFDKNWTKNSNYDLLKEIDGFGRSLIWLINLKSISKSLNL